MQVTTNQMAEILGVSQAKMSRLKKAGCPCSGRGRWDVAAACQWYICRLKREAMYGKLPDWAHEQVSVSDEEFDRKIERAGKELERSLGI
jgi:phage terminase Nu1 subunit (DNA packaging protein)